MHGSSILPWGTITLCKMTVQYFINLFPGYPTGRKVEVKNLTIEGVTILLHNLQRDALLGNEVKNVTVLKG